MLGKCESRNAHAKGRPLGKGSRTLKQQTRRQRRRQETIHRGKGREEK